MRTAVQIVSIAGGLGGLWVGNLLAADYARKLTYPHRAAQKTIFAVLLLGPAVLAYGIVYELLMMLG